MRAPRFVVVRSSPLFAVLVMTVVAGGCAQSGAGALPTSPSVQSGQLGAALGPGASYDASGSWHVEFRLADGTLLGEEDQNLIQDSDGNLTIEGNPGFKATRRPGTGAVLTYAVETFEGTGVCDERYSGVVTIFTRTNTLRGLLRGTESDCSRLQISITGTKN